jgi:serine protease AprX
MPDDPTLDTIAENLRRSRIAGDLVEKMRLRTTENVAAELVPAGNRFSVIIEGNAALPQGAGQARRLIALAYARSRGWDQPQTLASERDWITRLTRPEDPLLINAILFDAQDEVGLINSFWTDYYLFACLTPATIQRLTAASIDIPNALDGQVRSLPLVHKLWLNHPIESHVYESVRTVKCDAARAAFAAAGLGIVWAVADTGIDRRHPHFQTHSTLDLPDGLQRCCQSNANSSLVGEPRALGAAG